MSVIVGGAALTAAGTPQSIAPSLTPALPSVVINGVSSGPGSATQQAFQIEIQADPANAGANMYVGNKAMTKTLGSRVIPKGTAYNLGQYGGGMTLDDLYFDGDTTGDKIRVTLVG